MNRTKPFNRADLFELGEFLGTADAVVPMHEVHAGNRNSRVIGLRHDVDNHPNALATAVEMAKWEAENGWHSTYFLLHTAAYWDDGRVFPAADEIASLGHEIGLHVDALANCLLHGGNPHTKVHFAMAELRNAGHPVTGVVGHGNAPICHVAEFANDEQFEECARLRNGEPDRTLYYKGRELTIEPRPWSEFGIAYDAVWLRHYEGPNGELLTRPNQLYNTDSAGRWYYRFAETVRLFQSLPDNGQLHLLTHPDHWDAAFERVAA